MLTSRSAPARAHVSLVPKSSSSGFTMFSLLGCPHDVHQQRGKAHLLPRQPGLRRRSGEPAPIDATTAGGNSGRRSLRRERHPESAPARPRAAVRRTPHVTAIAETQAPGRAHVVDKAAETHELLRRLRHAAARPQRARRVRRGIRRAVDGGDSTRLGARSPAPTTAGEWAICLCARSCAASASECAVIVNAAEDDIDTNRAVSQHQLHQAMSA